MRKKKFAARKSKLPKSVSTKRRQPPVENIELDLSQHISKGYYLDLLKSLLALRQVENIDDLQAIQS